MKNVTLAIIIAISAVCGLQAQSASQTQSENTIVTENRTVEGFDKIEIRGRFEVKLTQQKSSSVSVCAQERFLNYIETVVEDGTLIIKMKEPEGGKNFLDKIKEKYSDYFNRQMFEINIGIDNLNSIKMSGASNLNVNKNFNFDEISLDVSGASKLLMNCNTNKAVIDVSGASSAAFNGSAKNTSLNISGASSFTGGEFKCAKITADVSGASKASVFASDKFSGEASGASTIHCYGNPKTVQRNVSGASKITLE